MRLSLLAIPMLLALWSCTLFPSSTPEPQKLPEYPTTQSGSPAAKYCTQKWGQVTYEKNPNAPTMDLIFCTTKDWQKMDAWKYMDIETTQTGGVLVP